MERRAVDDPALSGRLLLAGRRLYGRAFGTDLQTVRTEGNR
jgi:hypothetical protein